MATIAGTSMGKQPEKVVNITQLNLPQLDQLKTQLEEVSISWLSVCERKCKAYPQILTENWADERKPFKIWLGSGKGLVIWLTYAWKDQVKNTIHIPKPFT